MAEKIKVATPSILSEFLTGCKDLFATQSEVSQNDADIGTYVLNIDYEKELAFDTDEIV